MVDVNRGGKQFHDRQNSLTPNDVEVLTQIFKSIIDAKEHNTHECRFPSVSEKDLIMMVEAHKQWLAFMTDNKKIIQKFFLGLFLTLATGYTLTGSWSKAAAAFKRIFTGE